VIKTIIFDTDGMVIRGEMYFSERLSKNFGIPPEKVIPFFKNEFQLCLTNKADLKEELKKYLPQWKWGKSVDVLLEYWFKNETAIDKQVIESIMDLRNKGIKCYLGTNNEKYRMQYLINKLGLGNFFDGIFSSAHIGYLKPQQEFWQSIYEQLGKPNKEEILVWDNDEKNITSAENFGFQAKLYADFKTYEVYTKTLMI
jgi:putative hydrolase of the HAD superfamily